MLVRTTLSLEEQYVNQLKELTVDSSLSKYINQIIKDFLERQNKEKRLKQMAENYKKHATQQNQKSFSELEEMSLEDLENRNSFAS